MWGFKRKHKWQSKVVYYKNRRLYKITCTRCGEPQNMVVDLPCRGRR